MGDFIVISGIIVFLIGWVGGVRLAFAESPRMGFWALFVPVVWVYFIFTRNPQTIRYAVVSLAGLCMVLVGIYAGQ